MILGWCVVPSKLGLLGHLFAGGGFAWTTSLSWCKGVICPQTLVRSMVQPLTFHGSLRKLYKNETNLFIFILQECKRPKSSKIWTLLLPYTSTPHIPRTPKPVALCQAPRSNLACWALGASMTMPTNSSRSRCWGNETHGFFPKKFLWNNGRKFGSISEGWLSHCPRVSFNSWNTTCWVRKFNVTNKKLPSHKESSFQTHFFRGQ